MRQTPNGSMLGLLVLLPILAGASALRAQVTNEPQNSNGQLAPAPSNSQDSVATGRILILEGQGVRNSITAKTAISPVIQLLSVDGRPIVDAEVVFRAPATGAGGLFGLAPIATTKTDRVGQATARFTPNNQAGRFTIQVQAKWPRGAAEASIVQYNDPNLGSPVTKISKRPWFRDWRVWAAAGGAAAVSTWLVQRNGTGGQPSITIIPSPIGIGGAR